MGLGLHGLHADAHVGLHTDTPASLRLRLCRCCCLWPLTFAVFTSDCCPCRSPLPLLLPLAPDISRVHL